MLNYQEVFTKVVTALLKQNAKSQSPGVIGAPVCLYRAGELRCAIGHLIPDEAYSPEIEGCGIGSLRMTNTLFNSLPDYTSTNAEHCFLSQLQDAHDIFTPDNWHERFVAIAERHNLTMPC